MTIQNSNSLCRQMALHYYDVLTGHIDDVPREALVHIEQCDNCRSEIKQLKAALEEPDDPRQTAKDNAVISSLERHFSYTNVPVGCGHVKPLLPSLADPMLEIRVPTPIMAHIDNCPQCKGDLETIRQLRLSQSQLDRLGKLFAEVPENNPVLCAKTRKTIPFMARLDFASLPADVLKHVCLCPDCRKVLADKWEMESARLAGQPSCGEVESEDIFDYAMPYGLEIENNKSAVAHIMTCPDCFAKVQDVHNQVFGILERPASDVITKFQIDQSVKDGKQVSSAPYSNWWSIQVKVTHQSEFARRLAQTNFKRFIRPAAAAVILLALLFYFINAPITQAVNLDEIYKAVAKIANIHIERFVPSEIPPTQQQWISKTLKISIYKTPTEMILWDVQNSSRRAKNIATGEVTTTSLSSDSLDGIRKTIEGSLGLLPFDRISDLPQDAQWREITDGSIKTVSPDVKVYELTWIEKSAKGENIFKKWRAFIDTKTNLPQRVEWYSGKDYVLQSYVEAAYVTESRIQAVIKEAAF